MTLPDLHSLSLSKFVGTSLALVCLARIFRGSPAKPGPVLPKTSADTRTCIVLMNIGSPKNTSVAEVRRYLRCFLGDSRVFDVSHKWINPILIYLISRFRAKSSAEAYAEVWQKPDGADGGSPLVLIHEDIRVKLEQNLRAQGKNVDVRTGFQYSEPFMEDLIRSGQYDRLICFPIYPMYATSSLGGALDMAYRTAAPLPVTPIIQAIGPYFEHPAYIRAVVTQIEPMWSSGEYDHLVISYHSLPEYQLQNVISPSCEMGKCCHQEIEDCDPRRNCYRRQCFKMAKAIAAAMELRADQYTVAFQSRLTLRNRIKWVEPYTDKVIEAARHHRLLVASPGFPVDCLETIQELGIEAREIHQEHEGEPLNYGVVPCPNLGMAEAIPQIIEDALKI